MVKMFAVLRRNPELTREEFVTHWRDHHGPMIRNEPTLARHIVRYEQHVRLHNGSLSGNKDIDGVAVQWFDSIDGFGGFMSEPKYAELIAPDEQRFLDMDALEFIITEEPTVVIDGDVGATVDPTNGAAA
jgi:uncharacterized protein (TIGR02118 family)